jgi:hypothetical protein
MDTAADEAASASAAQAAFHQASVDEAATARETFAAEVASAREKNAVLEQQVAKHRSEAKHHAQVCSERDAHASATEAVLKHRLEECQVSAVEARKEVEESARLTLRDTQEWAEKALEEEKARGRASEEAAAKAAAVAWEAEKRLAAAAAEARQQVAEVQQAKRLLTGAMERAQQRVAGLTRELRQSQAAVKEKEEELKQCRVALEEEKEAARVSSAAAAAEASAAAAAAAAASEDLQKQQQQQQQQDVSLERKWEDTARRLEVEKRALEARLVQLESSENGDAVSREKEVEAAEKVASVKAKEGIELKLKTVEEEEKEEEKEASTDGEKRVAGKGIKADQTKRPKGEEEDEGVGETRPLMGGSSLDSREHHLTEKVRQLQLTVHRQDQAAKEAARKHSRALQKLSEVHARQALEERAASELKHELQCEERVGQVMQQAAAALEGTGSVGATRVRELLKALYLKDDEARRFKKEAKALRVEAAQAREKHKAHASKLGQAFRDEKERWWAQKEQEQQAQKRQQEQQQQQQQQHRLLAAPVTSGAGSRQVAGNDQQSNDGSENEDAGIETEEEEEEGTQDDNNVGVCRSNSSEGRREIAPADIKRMHQVGSSFHDLGNMCGWDFRLLSPPLPFSFSVCLCFSPLPSFRSEFVNSVTSSNRTSTLFSSPPFASSSPPPAVVTVGVG